MPCDFTDTIFMDSNSTAILDCILEANISSAYDFFEHKPKESWGKTFSTYFTPFIIAIGLVGNIVSLRVFTSTRLRKLSASFYLAALSGSDTIVLLTYVLVNWVQKDLSSWQPGYSVDLIHRQGLCQGFLFVFYVFRFISVYLIVIFTIERYIAVCRPLRRRIICTKTFARKTILSIHIVGIVISIYKPLLVGLYSSNPTNAQDSKNLSYNENFTKLNDSVKLYLWSSHDHDTKICTWNPRYEDFHFLMDLSYGLLITAVPFILVAVFNILMLKELITKHFFSAPIRVVFRKSKIRIEFTITVIAVSTCFVLLNIPYFIAWLIQNLQTFHPTHHVVSRRNSEVVSLTRTIFSINYSINFFVYCLTGSFYRSVIKNMFGCGQGKNVDLDKKGMESVAGANSATEAMLMTEL